MIVAILISVSRLSTSHPVITLQMNLRGIYQTSIVCLPLRGGCTWNNFLALIHLIWCPWIVIARGIGMGTHHLALSLGLPLALQGERFCQFFACLLKHLRFSAFCLHRSPSSLHIQLRFPQCIHFGCSWLSHVIFLVGTPSSCDCWPFTFRQKRLQFIASFSFSHSPQWLPCSLKWELWAFRCVCQWLNSFCLCYLFPGCKNLESQLTLFCMFVSKWPWRQFLSGVRFVD